MEPNQKERKSKISVADVYSLKYLANDLIKILISFHIFYFEVYFNIM